VADNILRRGWRGVARSGFENVAGRDRDRVGKTDLPGGRDGEVVRVADDDMLVDLSGGRMHARSAILYTPVQLDFERVRRRTHLFEG